MDLTSHLFRCVETSQRGKPDNTVIVIIIGELKAGSTIFQNAQVGKQHNSILYSYFHIDTKQFGFFLGR